LLFKLKSIIFVNVLLSQDFLMGKCHLPWMALETAKIFWDFSGEVKDSIPFTFVDYHTLGKFFRNYLLQI